MMFEVGKRYDLEFVEALGERTFINGIATEIDGPLLKLKIGNTETIYNTYSIICVSIKERRELPADSIYQPMKPPPSNA